MYDIIIFAIYIATIGNDIIVNSKNVIIRACV